MRPWRVRNLASGLAQVVAGTYQPPPSGQRSRRVALSVLVFVALTGGSPALAEVDHPGLYRVEGVAADDTLNVRAAPDATSADIGDLLPGAVVEVTTVDVASGWARILWAEGDGWVSGRFLAPSGDAGAIPDTLFCLGTEPFWLLDATGDTLILETPEHSQISEVISTRDVARGSLGPGFLARSASMTLVAEPAACSDGMSDRTYGWRAFVVEDTDGGAGLFTGCCRRLR